MRWFLRLAPCLLFAVLTAPGPAAQSPPPPPPLPSELKEKIEVRLVTIDVVALDAHDVTVPDLTKGDLELFVDGKPSQIDTFDAYCASGAEADPKSLRFGQWPTPRDLQTGTRRVVLAFDYLHLRGILQVQALQEFQHMFKAKTEIADEELMVVALTGGLRVEQPFTKDREAVVNTLRRMEHDISLWNGNFAHETETPLFRSLGALVTVLRATPGPKAVVFLSAGAGPVGSFYDLDFDRLAAAASDSQVSFYTVDCRGVFARYSTDASVMSGSSAAPGPRGLFRLASMTGGRLTRSNDATVGYARARRDLGCRYTVGFYDQRPEADKRHQVSVNSRRKGVHLIYGARYSVPSEQTRRRQTLDAAFLVPQQFAGGGLRAHVFPLQPQDAKLWNAVLVVEFPVELKPSGRDATWEFGVVLRRGTDVLNTFNRSISVSANDEDAEGDAPRVTFVEPVTLPPGTYSLTAVLVLPEGTKPFGQVADLTVPPLPKREAILTGPVLGRRRGNDVVVYGGGDAKGTAGDRVGARDAFRPLLIDEVDRSEPLAALTNACVFRPKAKDGPWSISRALATGSGEPAGSLADVTFATRAGTPLQCESFLDELPVQQLKPGRYTFRAVLAEADSKPDQKKEAMAPFLVNDPAPAAGDH